MKSFIVCGFLVLNSAALASDADITNCREITDVVYDASRTDLGILYNANSILDYYEVAYRELQSLPGRMNLNEYRYRYVGDPTGSIHLAKETTQKVTAYIRCLERKVSRHAQ